LFNKVLVANRGEIAVRVMRACRELGVRSVAVYSEADLGALHARYADEAYCIGGPTAAESYLNAAAIVACARACGADAVHPGYGFLSEQADFAEACAEAGIKFIGPSPATLRLVGDKVAARGVAVRANVPTVPGSQGRVTADEALAAAGSIGYPLLIKAAAGGGGKGIRRVDQPEELENAVRTAAAEAEANFGDGGLYVERYLDPVRHIEVQVVADGRGGIVHLGERECSLQRRSQKIVEESPSPAVDAALRERLGAAAVAVMREAGYENAGTVEFLFDDATREFYFIEVNARIQVEHPVTELVTGIDLIQTQLRIASGEALGLTQGDVALRGWAIECRLTAEDAGQDFLPSLGHVSLVNEPSGPGVRVDSSLFTGLEVGPYYDSMLAKVIAWGADRPAALARLRRALDEYELLGVKTTLPFLRRLAADEAFAAGAIYTRFLEHRADLFESEPRDDGDNVLLAAALLSHRRRSNGTPAANGTAPVHAGSSMWRTAAKRAAVDRRGGGSWRSTT
jgi:acetyl-CoA carboxylase biotin carboxylase subunit